LLWLLQAAPAVAHAPYFTQIQKVMLPDGQIGEARLLHGDGIFIADPVRVIIVDATGRLLARSHRSTTMALSCSRELHCRGFDVGDGKVLEIDPETFREGPVVPPSGGELGTIEAGNESWGFRVRPASLLEYAEAELALARRSLGELVVLLLVGTFVGFAFLMIRGRTDGEESKGVFFYLFYMIKVISALLILLMAGLFTVMAASGLSVPLTLISIGAGIALRFAMPAYVLKN
jgi:hypothetical protein